MPLAETASGTQTAVVGTTHTLATITTGKTCVLYVDLSALAAGDIVELAALEKVLSTSTAATALVASFSGVQVEPVAVSVPFAAVHSLAFTLRQTVGTGRAFPWSVRSLD